MTAPVRLIVLGARGRMGRAVTAAAAAVPGFEVAAEVTRDPAQGAPGSAPRFATVEDALSDVGPAVIVDFTVAGAVGGHAAAAGAAGAPLVEGTTGLDADADVALRTASGRIPVVVAPNMSPGIAVLRRMLSQVAASSLEWEATVLDRHHRRKRDAPSGTALLLRRALERGSRPEPPIVSLRQGDIVGEHTVWLGGEDEELVITHRALDRGLFARGALRAAAFVAGAAPGLYAMDDVLGLGRGPEAGTER